MTAPLRWGVLGVSELVGRKAVLPALKRSAFTGLLAIASRSKNRSIAEAARFGVSRAYGSYEELIRDPDIEAVYIPLPNSLHYEWTLKAAQAGKHILCEKPLAVNTREAEFMAQACQKAGVVLMEAYMTPFHPRSSLTIEMTRSGALGELRFARAAFTGLLRDSANHRWFPVMGGGSLLDVGIYCLAPLVAAAGREPLRVASNTVTTPNGVDSSFSGWLDFGDGFTASFETSFEVAERQRLELVGTKATLSIDRAFTPSESDTEIQVAYPDGRVELLTCEGNDPYLAMVEHFAMVVRGLATPQRTPSDSIAVLRLFDRLREAAGVRCSV